MPPVVHSFDEPERFVAGTVGPPGQRTFFLQAREGARLVSVALEKQQVALLAERLEMLLDEALRRSGGDPRIPALAPPGLSDQEPLDQPIEEEFRVGTITIGWDDDAGRAVIELFPASDETVVVAGYDDEDEDEDDEDEHEHAVEALSEEDDEPEDDEQPDEVVVEVEASEVLVVRLPPAYARAFVRRAQSVVSAGRPACQFCGGPIDPEGHLCPRANGFRRTTA